MNSLIPPSLISPFVSVYPSAYFTPPDTERFVVVAFVVVAVVIVRPPVIVEEADTIIPAVNERRVEVAASGKG